MRPSGPKKVSLADVATDAEVSTNTIPRVVRGDPEAADATGARISALLDEMGYRSNYAARALVPKKTGVLHVLFAAPVLHGHGRVLFSVLNVGPEAGYHVSLSNAYRSDGVSHMQIAPLDVDGVVILIGQDPSVEPATKIGKGIPTCLLLSSEKNLEGISMASIGNVRGSGLTVEYPLRQGVSGIVHIVGPQNRSDTVMWRQGFTQACEETGVEGQVIESFSWNAHDGYDAMRSLSYPSQALQCVSDQLALGAIRPVHERGIKIPEDVHVVGFDDVDGTDCYTPSLMTVRQPFDRLGCTKVRLVRSPMEGGRAEDATIDPELVIRVGSTF